MVGNWDVVTNIAGGARDATTGMLESPATVTGVRIWSDPPEALEAWRTEATNWPKCRPGNVAVEVSGTNGTLRCGWSPKSQYAVVHGGDLTAESRNVVWMDWNEGGETAWAELPFQASEEGTVPFGKRHFCAVAQVGYPGLEGPAMRGNGWGVLTEWQWGDGTVDTYLHELDWNAGTGMVWKATDDGGWTNDAAVRGMGFWRAGAHSTELVLAEQVPDGMIAWTYYHYYRLGAEGDDGTGRFRMSVFTGSGTVEVWGDWAWVETANMRLARGGGRGGGGAVAAFHGLDEDKAGTGILTWLPAGTWRGEALPPERSGWTTGNQEGGISVPIREAVDESADWGR